MVSYNVDTTFWLKFGIFFIQNVYLCETITRESPQLKFRSKITLFNINMLHVCKYVYVRILYVIKQCRFSCPRLTSNDWLEINAINLLCYYYVNALKEYYEIVNGSPPSIGILPQYADFYKKFISTHSKFKSRQVIIASQSTFEK